MNFEQISRRLGSMTFRQAVWLFPLAYVLHVLEELPQFTNWARINASSSYTLKDYFVVHLSGIVVAVLAPVVIRLFQNRVVVFLFFTFVFTPAVFFNILFHTGSTVIFGMYAPGLLTALTVYPPLFYFLSRLAFREGYLTNRAALVSFLLAGAFHAADVAHNVFKIW